MTPEDIAFSWGELFSALGLLFTVVVGVTGAIFAVYRQIRSVKTDLDSFRLEVAKDYVNAKHMNDMREELIRSETKTLAAIQGLAERFDRFLDRQQ